LKLCEYDPAATLALPAKLDSVSAGKSHVHTVQCGILAGDYNPRLECIGQARTHAMQAACLSGVQMALPSVLEGDRDLAAPLSVHLAWGLRYSSKPTKVSQSIFRGDQANAGHRLRPDLTKTQHERTLHSALLNLSLCALPLSLVVMIL
jgi:hypothetical protein